MLATDSHIKPVLLIDDSSDDALLLKRAFRRAGIPNRVVHLQGGELGLDEFERALAQRECWAPALILVDIKMPRIDGFEVLKWVKNRPEFTGTPAVMFTSSSLPEEMLRAEMLGAASFFTKPHNFQELIEMARRMDERWLRPGG